MRSRFSAPAVSTIEVSRLVDGAPETITFEVQTLPPGWIECLRAQFDEPQRFVNGKPAPVGAGEVAVYKNRVAALTLAKALEGGADELDTKLPGHTTNRRGWEVAADGVLAEFHEAGFTSAEVAHLYQEVWTANESVERVRLAERRAREAQSGNSRGLEGVSP